METMKAVRIHRFGGPDVMRMEDLAVPQPNEDEVLLRVHAASVNPVDYKMRSGDYPPVTEAQLPLTLGRDVSGVIEACGENVNDFARGDAVYALLGADRGGFAEYVTVAASAIAMKPEGLDHVQAAAVPLAALTAWQGLFDHGTLAKGERVLIHGGGGGVGHFAVQLARICGAHVFATVSSADVDFVRELGAEQVIDYKREQFDELVGDMDLVLDLVDGETRDRSWAVLKRGGRLVSALGEPSTEKAVERNVQAIGFLAEPNAPELAAIGELIATEKVRPRIQESFPLARATEAEQRQEQEHIQGKLVLKIVIE